jgi:hypothetical protein
MLHTRRNTEFTTSFWIYAVVNVFLFFISFLIGFFHGRSIIYRQLMEYNYVTIEGDTYRIIEPADFVNHYIDKSMKKDVDNKHLDEHGLPLDIWMYPRAMPGVLKPKEDKTT